MASAQEQIQPLNADHRAMAVPDVSTCEDRSQGYFSIADLIAAAKISTTSPSANKLG